MIERLWEWAKPKLAVCAIFGLLVEGVGSWRAGHWLNADEWIAAEDAAVCGCVNGLYRLVMLPFGGAGQERVCGNDAKR